MSDDTKKEDLQQRVRELEAEVHDLQKNSIHDALTGLKTRAFFEEEAKFYLDSIWEKAASKRKQWFGFKNMSFLFIDIDHFKKVNDTYGHDVGDMVLKSVADTVSRSLRGGDTAARWGGEEMAVSLLGANEEDAFHTALRMNELVRLLRFEEISDLKVTISIGIASAEEGVPFEELIKRADTAMYEAKENGRDAVVKWSELKG